MQTQNWGSVYTNLTLNTPVINIDAFAQSSEGAIYASITKKLENPDYKIIKSVNGGHTWAISGIVGQPTAPVLKIVCHGTTVYYITNSALCRSTDGGITFITMLSVPVGTDFLTSFDIGSYSGRNIVILGVNSAIAGATLTAGVYYLDEGIAFYVLQPLGKPSFGPLNILSVKTSPNFGTDHTVVAIGTDLTTGKKMIRTTVIDGAWGALIPDCIFGTAPAATAADIAFPSDFNSTTNFIYFFVLSDVNDGGVFRVLGNVRTNLEKSNLERNYNNIVLSGPFVSGTASILIGSSIGTVKKSTDSGLSFSSAILNSEVNGKTAWVLFDNNYAINKQAYVMHSGSKDGALTVIKVGTIEASSSKIVDETTKIEDKLYMYLSSRVLPIADKLIRSESFLHQFTRDEPYPMVVISVDLRRSTELMLKAKEPKKFGEFMSDLATKLSETVINNYGIFDKFTGDGVLAFFPDYYSGKDALLWAVKAAKECHTFFEKYYRNNRSYFIAVLNDVGLGIGIDFEKAQIVKIQNDFTVVGAPVVYACRLSGCPAGTTLLNQGAYDVAFTCYPEILSFKETTYDAKNEGNLVVHAVESLTTKNDNPKPPSWIENILSS